MSATRRTFLLRGFGASTTAWLAANWPAQVAAAEAAQAMGHFTYFTPPQAMEIDAMAQQIYPSDSTPGAKEAQVIYFIDLALVTFAQDKQAIYKQGFGELSAKTGGKPLGSMPVADRAADIHREYALLPHRARPHHHGHVRRAPAWRQLPEDRMEADRLRRQFEFPRALRRL